MPYIFKTFFKLCLGVVIFMPGANAQKNEKEIDSVLKIAYQKLDKNNDEALALAQKCLGASEKLAYKKGEAVAYMQMGRVYKRKGNFTMALNNYIKAVQIFEKLEDFINLASVNNSIAIIYLNMEDYKKAIFYENVALNKLNQAKSINHEDSARFINIYNHLGAANYRLKQYDQAYIYFMKAMKVAQLRHDHISEGITLDNISKYYIAKKDYKKALECTQKAYRLKLKDGDLIDVANTMLDLGIINTAMGQNREALDYYKRAYKLIVDSIPDMDMQTSGLINLLKGYENMGDYKNAFYYQSKYLKLNDSLFNINTNEKMVQMEALYQSEKGKRENKFLQIQNNLKEKNLKQERQQKQFLIAGLLLLMGFTFSIVYFLMKSRSRNIKLKKLNEHKNNIMSVLSHDMRSPFVKIDTLIKLELQHRKDKKELIAIKNIVDEGMNMLTNILDVSYLEDKTPVATISEIDVLELMQLSVEENMLNASQKQIGLKLDVSMENIIIYTDRAMLKRIMDNLLSNAIKYSYPESEVNIEVKRTENEDILFSIHDHGQGISEEEQNKLFIKYEKLSSMPTGGEVSTGLGLYISAWMVQLLKGKIWCESLIGKGSNFYVKLPNTLSPIT